MEKKCEREDMSAIDTERMKNLKKMRETLIYDAYYLPAENYLKHGKMAISKPRVDMFLDQCSRLQEEDSYRSLWNMTITPLGHAKQYSLKEIEDMTDNFQPYTLIKSTKYGRMFSYPTNEAITIKTWDFFWPDFNGYSYHPSRFCNELEILTDDNPHACLMKLKGFCFQNILAIVYDETPIQFLSYVISDGESFRWEDRMKVAAQLATLFIWLHEKQFAIGRMEPSSIMIDKDFNMKVIDFPFLVRVRDIPHNILPDAPEADNVTETLKDDVYAFGILLLRLITNNKSIEGPYHCWIQEELQGGKGSIVDKSVLLNCDGVLACGITKLATECLDEDPNARPDMKNVSDRLTNLMSEIGFEQRQVCVAISERPGEQFGQTRMISVLTLALAVGVVGFFLFKKH
ncbi:probable receptor-like protein kinase At1g80640 [Solanum verrucosum]|uniref:probable receptor-like protein kinase At1g80640 n=1 Tax=Solanum verrucosum TaxID=315347 RepID=UPI0020D1DCFA|nr:probable receptor-like protein kinase At1g80640 [Solanum verrucosum]